MDGLTYQLELSDSFDSGHATGAEDEEEEDQETEDEQTEDGGGELGGEDFSPCEQCGRVATEVGRSSNTAAFFF